MVDDSCTAPATPLQRGSTRTRRGEGPGDGPGEGKGRAPTPGVRGRGPRDGEAPVPEPEGLKTPLRRVKDKGALSRTQNPLD